MFMVTWLGNFVCWGGWGGCLFEFRLFACGGYDVDSGLS